MTPEALLTLELRVEPSAFDWRAGPGVVAPLLGRVETVCRKLAEQAGAGIRVGRFVSTRHQTEVGVFLDHGPRVGAFVGLLWKPGNATVQVSVRPGSPTHVRLQWAAFVGSLVAAFAVAAAFRPYADARLALAGALLGGCVLGVVAMIGVVRLGLGMDVSASHALAERLAKRVRRKLASADDSLPLRA